MPALHYWKPRLDNIAELMRQTAANTVFSPQAHSIDTRIAAVPTPGIHRVVRAFCFDVLIMSWST